MSVRNGRASDLSNIVRIYNHAIVNTVATFDLEPVESSERADWFERFGAEFPLLVYDHQGELAGFGYYLPYRLKPGYAQTMELTVYVDPDAQRLGIGEALYRQLIARARDAGVHVLLGVLGGDNPASAGLHEKLGFKRVAVLPEVGRKFGAWVDTVIYQLIL